MRHKSTIARRYLTRATIVISVVIAATAGIASAQNYDLKSPFRPGDVHIYGDENYFNGDPHPSTGAIAFDIIDDPRSGPSPMYAMGTGEIRLLCTHVSGASVLEHRVPGYDGAIRLAHMQGSTHPNWITSEWTSVQQGQYIGNVYPDPINPRPGDSCWQYSSGRHLHLDLPQAETVIDGEVWSRRSPNIREVVTSTNVETTPGRPNPPETPTTTETPRTTTSTTEAPRSTTSRPPRTTSSTEAPRTTSSTEAPRTTTSTEAPRTTSSTEAPRTTSSTEAPRTTTSTEAPRTTTTQAPPAPAPAPEGVVMCGGFEATIIGTPGTDRIVGTNGPDVIAGLQGNDIISGLGGDDIICGGYGNDILVGGQGFDVMYGAQGDDTLYAADGMSERQREDIAGSRMFGGADNDRIFGSSRWDRMQGGDGDDYLYGFEGRDWMRGGAGHDFLDGGPNYDDLHGGNGTDRIAVSFSDIVRGGASAQDQCDLSGGTPATMISCERIVR